MTDVQSAEHLTVPLQVSSSNSVHIILELKLEDADPSALLDGMYQFPMDSTVVSTFVRGLTEV